MRVQTRSTFRRRLVGLAAAIGLAAAPGFVVPATSAADVEPTMFPAFGLPFAPGQAAGSMGVHSDDGATGVRNAIDLTPNDGIVRAALGGTVRVWQCAGGPWVTVDHVEGWRTGYYHMENIQVSDGQQVGPGQVLGTIGNALPCGGSSSGAHVHFTLWYLTAAPAMAANWDGVSYEQLADISAVIGEPVNGKVFGNWQWFEGAAQYSGYTVRLRDGWTVPLPGTFLYEG